MFTKLRAFADIGRTQGITTTASIAIVGAITSTAPIEWYHIVYFTVLSIFSHMALNTYIALGDIALDSHTYVPSRNPVSVGILSKKEAMRFVYAATILCILLVLGLFLFNSNVSVIFTLLCFFPAYTWLLWYGWTGKRYPFSYDFSFSVSYGFFILLGVFAVDGMPTIYTWIWLGVVTFAATAFAQWENGLKDVDADCSVGVRSFAVLTGVKNNMRLGVFHPYFLYGVVLKVSFLVCCFLTYFVFSNLYYLIFLLVYGVPSQLYVLYRFARYEKPVDHRRTILLDVTFSAILGYSIVIGKTMDVVVYVLLIVYLIVGYFIGSQIQYQCEFKFSRFSKQK